VQPSIPKSIEQQHPPRQHTKIATTHALWWSCHAIDQHTDSISPIIALSMKAHFTQISELMGVVLEYFYRHIKLDNQRSKLTTKKALKT
jgi:hypothetical protein